MTLWSYLREKLLEHPHQLVCESDASMTYEELCAFAEHYAEQLTAPYYGIFCKSEMASAIALLACIAAGKPAIPLPARYGTDYCFKICERSRMPAIISDSTGDFTQISIYPQSQIKKTPTNTAVVLFTSGSTGKPKGVMLSEKNLISNVEDISSYFPIGQEDTILISRPLHHSSVLTGEFLLALCTGAKIVFTSESFQPLNIIRHLKKYNITVLGSTPTLLSVLSGFLRKDEKHTVRLLSISGECMTEGMAKRIRKAFPDAAIYCGYGLSEASPRVAYLPAELFDSFPTAAGKPLPSVKLSIKGKKGSVQNADQIGELLVKGPNVMKGYFDDPARTKSTIQKGWLHTGDLAYWDEKGMLHIHGRKDDMIIRAGMNVYPTEIENVLSRDSRVKDVLVYGYESNGTQEIGLKISGAFSSVQNVKELCVEKLPKFQIPAKIELVSEAEFASSGKKKRKK